MKIIGEDFIEWMLRKLDLFDEESENERKEEKESNS